MFRMSQINSNPDWNAFPVGSGLWAGPDLTGPDSRLLSCCSVTCDPLPVFWSLSITLLKTWRNLTTQICNIILKKLHYIISYEYLLIFQNWAFFCSYLTNYHLYSDEILVNIFQPDANKLTAWATKPPLERHNLALQTKSDHFMFSKVYQSLMSEQCERVKPLGRWSCFWFRYSSLNQNWIRVGPHCAKLKFADSYANCY